MTKQDFRTVFERATGHQPYPYQQRLAENPLPDALALRAPTGSGKTAAAVLAWLWQRRFSGEAIRSSTPRRLVYCLPMRVLVEQTAQNIRSWLHRLGLESEVPVHVLMGGMWSKVRANAQEDWDLYPESDQIIVGTQDMLISRALNRGYACSRFRWPSHFGLLNNDCLWILDEIQLMGASLETSTQLHAFRQLFGTIGPAKSLWMSATLETAGLESYDFKRSAEIELGSLDLRPDDLENPALKQILEAAKTHRRARYAADQPKELAGWIKDLHVEGSRTLIVVNTVKRAVDLYHKIKRAFRVRSASKHNPFVPAGDGHPEIVLIHSRFRPPERRLKVERLKDEIPSEGQIVVATQVIEAGLDIDSRTLVTENAPWPSLVQRFGRCNRRGKYDLADVYVVDVPEKSSGPYKHELLEKAKTHLERLSDLAPLRVTEYIENLDLSQRRALYEFEEGQALRRKDILDLFDTSADLSGHDVDVSHFIRTTTEMDVKVYWRDFAGTPSEELRRVSPEEVCAVPVGSARTFIKDRKNQRERVLWFFDFLEGAWVQASDNDVIPGRTFLASASTGGYSKEIGWDGKTAPVDPVPVAAPTAAAAEEGEMEPIDSDDVGSPSWKTIAEHTEEVLQQLDAILRQMGNGVGGFADVLRTAAMHHDWGKAHPVFQKRLGAFGPPRPDVWAKSGGGGFIGSYARRGFRHELASALAMLGEDLDDLACYLAAAHHGKVRLSIRSLPTEKPPDGSPETRFARGIWEGDELPSVEIAPGIRKPATVLSLDVMEMGLTDDGRPSWTERILKLRDDPEIGPFRLALLEAILRAADARGSMNAE